MQVKIVSEKSRDFPYVIECGKYNFHPSHNKNHVLLVMMGVPGIGIEEQHLELDDGIEVYITNNQGQTIDTHYIQKGNFPTYDSPKEDHASFEQRLELVKESFRRLLDENDEYRKQVMADCEVAYNEAHEPKDAGWKFLWHIFEYNGTTPADND